MSSKKREKIRVYIGLGSNLKNPAKQLRKALIELAELTASTLVAQSSLYKSAPMDAGEDQADQPDYINAVAVVDTYLPALALLDNLHEIEARHGRDRSTAHWGPRTLDLDLLLYGEKIIQKKRLVVPHPGLCEREFVLYPLFELKPDLLIPADPEPLMLSELVENCPKRGLKKLKNQAG